MGRNLEKGVLGFRFEVKKIQSRSEGRIKRVVERSRQQKDILESYVDTGISLQQVIKLWFMQFWRHDKKRSVL